MTISNFFSQVFTLNSNIIIFLSLKTPEKYIKVFTQKVLKIILNNKILHYNMYNALTFLHTY